MKKRLYFLSLSLIFSGLIFAQESLNVNLFGQFDRGDGRYSGVWSYVAADGSEYALLGARTGTAIYSIDDSTAINEICLIPGPITKWREITVLGNYAYVVTDAQGQGHSMQVIDLNSLPYSATVITSYTATFDKGHIIQRDLYSEAPYVYVMGTGLTEGVHIMDVSDPHQPSEVGFYQPGYYIHDCFVKGDQMYASAFYENTIDIVDISDKSNPVLITKIEDLNGATHSAFLTEDDGYLIVCGESDGLPAIIYNVKDLENISIEAKYTANRESLVHNPYVKGNFVYFSHNTEGLRIVDIADPTVPIEVGYYDTFDGPSGGFNGLWSACPFLPSGKILGGNREDGLYIWTFDELTAGRFYGQVVDSLTKEPIFNASIIVLQKSDTLFSDFSGQFKSGGFPGFYTLFVSAEGYHSKFISLALSGGDSLNISVALRPILSVVIDPVQNIPILSNFPNPFRSHTLLDFKNFPTAHRLDLYNIAGKRVTSLSVAGYEQYQLDRQQFPAGVYVYCLIDQSGKTLGVGEMLML